MAFRNALGVAVALFAGIALGNPSGGVLAATGALDTAFSDGNDPYVHRGRRMLSATFFVGLAVFVGRLCGNNHLLTIALEFVCAFVAGILVALGTTPSDIGTITLVTLIVYSATPASSFGKALTSGALALAGGILQTLFSLALWPVKRYAPESRALALLYEEMARSAKTAAPATEAPPATDTILAARSALAGLNPDRSVEAERYLALFSQAERIRLALLTLGRLDVRIGREPDTAAETEALAAPSTSPRAFSNPSPPRSSPAPGQCSRRLPRPAPRSRPSNSARATREPRGPEASPALTAMRADARWQLDALTGQLTSAVELAAHASLAGAWNSNATRPPSPGASASAGVFAVLRANYSLESAAFRHAVRLAVCVRYRRHPHPFLRLAARLLGTHDGRHRPQARFHHHLHPRRPPPRRHLRGLALATVLFLAINPVVVVQVGLAHRCSCSVMRWVGPANYGILVSALTGLVVLLFALSGVPPNQVIAGAPSIPSPADSSPSPPTAPGPRGNARSSPKPWPAVRRLPCLLPGDPRRLMSNPARGRPRLPRRVSIVFARPGASPAPTWKPPSRAFVPNPAPPPNALTALNTILANSHRLIHAMMSLEADIFRSEPVPARLAFRTFANDVDATLYFLAAYLRGTAVHPGDLPDLREDHRALLHSGDPAVERYELVNVETDRVTNSLNTLAVEILHWVRVTIPELGVYFACRSHSLRKTSFVSRYRIYIDGRRRLFCHPHPGAVPAISRLIVPGVWFREGDLENLGHSNNTIIEMKDYLIVVDANFPSGARLILEDRQTNLR